jgi:hypothetical protein
MVMTWSAPATVMRLATSLGRGKGEEDEERREREGRKEERRYEGLEQEGKKMRQKIAEGD